ncbi:MAG TPA: M3 family metallopeptidase [Thermohalobaculum sp.]|nr:M3 family metallopeptidase [Thermohalobaculum sp.]
MSNPLLETWTGTPFGLPPFARIEDRHFLPAFERAIEEHEAEVHLVAVSTDWPDFDNTIGALERAGRKLGQVSAVFFHLVAVDTHPERQSIERKIAPRLAQHRNAVLTNQRLFGRIESLMDEGDALGLDDEQARVLERYHRMFVRAGARLKGQARERMGEIMERLAELGTRFGQNVQEDESAWVMWLDEEGLEGLPDFVVEAAAAEATRRRAEGRHAITLSRSSVVPFLTFSPRRDLREAALRAWTDRGEADNWPLIEETVRLRAERAELLGFADFASYKLEPEMAKTPEAVAELLERVWEPAVKKARAEEKALAKLAAKDGQNTALEPWDWRYYAEKARRQEHEIDDAEVKPYLRLEGMIAAAFDVAGRLFGLTFRPLEGVPLPHPQARAWEVTGADGAHLGVFIGDYFARPSKRSGAWASGLRRQQKLREPHRPIVCNTCNFAESEPALLTWDDARTLFHEFGHALHALLSDVTYPLISGSSVARDFVELPSQLYEHWLEQPEVIRAHARHHRTGEPMPDELIARLKAADKAGQGFATVEYLASALVDLAMHRLARDAEFDGPAFEREVLDYYGKPAAIPMRHRSPHFLHVFTGDGYSAGYYSYLWSEVMDADAFRAFEEAGDAFDRETADKLRRHILAAGGSRDEAEAYVAFRGRMPGVEALLEGRGLDDAA